VKVGDLLQAKGTAVATVGTTANVSDALAILAEHDVGALVVSDDGQRIAGIVSERDIVRALADRSAAVLAEPVSALMTTEVRTCDPDTTVDELMALMTERRIRHVPVVVDELLAGIVSIGDAVKHRIGELESEAQTMHEYIWHGR
jgi:CBS domain-containing protein